MSVSDTAAPTRSSLARTGEILPARKPKLRAIDREFLPAALEIIETPPSPAGPALILIICALAATMLAWSYVGTLDITATAQGKLQPTGRVKTVQAFETSHVGTISVQNGSHVGVGDVLVGFDARDALADLKQSELELASYRAEILRRKAAIDLARGGDTSLAPAVAWPDDIPASVSANEDRILTFDLSQLTSQVGSLRAQMAQKRAELQRLDGTIAAEKELLRTMQERVNMRSELLEKESGSRASVIEALETLQQQKTALARDTGQVAEVAASLDAIGQDVQKTFDMFVADNAQKYVEAQRRADQVDAKLARARVQVSQMVLRSPISGTVHGSVVTTIGQVVAPSEELMRVVPDDARLEVEAYLPNKDIGFVREGQDAILKFESFPFTRYGTVDAKVLRVAHDAVPEPDAQQTEQNPVRAQQGVMRTGAQRMQNLVFPITLAFDKRDIEVDGVRVALQPGMAVTAEIKTGKRRIIEYLLAPLLETGSEAMRER